MSIFKKFIKHKPKYYIYNNIITDTPRNWILLLGEARVNFLIKTGDLKPAEINNAI